MTEQVLDLTLQELEVISEFLGARDPLCATRILGGRSNLTFLLTDGGRRWVLRMPPRMGRTPTAHDVAREFRVTSALWGSGIPVPRPVVLCEDGSLIGGPFAISDYVEGLTIQAREDLDSLDDVTLNSVVAELVNTLAALHEIDYRSVGLERFGRPTDYAARQLRRWSAQWNLVGSPQHALLAGELMRRLSIRVLPQRRAAIVHGDFRLDNALVNPTKHLGGSIAAVVDWELSTIGDPVADVAMMCAYRNEAFDLIMGRTSAWTSPRIAGVDGLAALYESASGIQLSDWNSHLALAYFKIGVIAAGIDHRVRAGASSDPAFASAGQSVGIYLQLGLDALRNSE